MHPSNLQAAVYATTQHKHTEAETGDLSLDNDSVKNQGSQAFSAVGTAMRAFWCYTL